MERSVTLLRVRGIPIGVNWSWLLIAALLTWVLGSALFPATHPGLTGATYLAMALAAALLFFTSILAHELAHALVGLREGVRIEGITLWLLGGVARFTGGVPSPATEFRMTVVGPFTSLALAALFGSLAYAGTSLGWPVAIRGVLEYLGRINLLLAGFNLVPALPLDGGRVLRAWLWHRQGDQQAATISASRAGRAFGFLLIWVGLLGFLTGAGAGGFWFVILGWFLLQAASAEASTAMVRETFRDRQVRELMTPEPATVDPRWPVDRFVEEAGRPGGHSTYPVVDDGRLVGLMSVRLAGSVPPDERPWRTVREVMVRGDDVPTVAADTPVADALDALQRGPRRAMVMEGDRVVGILSLADVARAVELERIRRRPAPARRPGVLVWVVVGLIMAGAAGYLYHPPLAVLSPGPALDLSRDVTIAGVPVQPVNGRFVATPVVVSRPNALGALYAAFDPERDVVPLSRIIPVGTDPQRVAEEQRELLRESQLLAAAAAASAMGMEVTLEGTGARVVGVVPGSPAAPVLQPGDVIVAVDATPVRLASDLRHLVASRPVGTTFSLSVERGDVRREIRLRSTRLERAGEGVPAIGVVADTRGLDVRLPFDIEFADRRIGGASAGLAYALAIADLLDPADLAAGRTIAATGTVDALGNVGAVGGLAGKAESARRAGADVFLVPGTDVEMVQGDSIDVRGVDSLTEAVDLLRSVA